jgi:hypothetical protein
MSGLTDGEADLLAQELEKIMDKDRPVSWVEGMLGAGGPKIIRGIKPGEACVVAQAVVRRARLDGIYEVPPWLYAIADLLREVPAVAEVRAKLSAVPPPRPDVDEPLETHRLDFGLPFLDRKDLRTAVGKVVKPDGYGVLVVRGDPKTGKSYTADYATWLSARVKDTDAGESRRFKVAIACIDPKDPLIWTPRFVVETLLSNMGRAPLAPEQLPETGYQHIQGLCNWLLGEVPMGERWWWIVDGACAADVPEETQQFLMELAQRITAGSTRERARLVLLDWPADVPGNLKVKIKADQLGDPDAIGDVDVRDYLRRLLEEVSDDADPATLDELCDKVLKDVPCGTARLPTLSENIRLHTSEMLEKAGLI